MRHVAPWRSLALAILVVTAVQAGERKDPDRRIPAVGFAADLGRSGDVVVNPWNGAGQDACSVTGCGGELTLDHAARMASLRLGMVDDAVTPRGDLLPRTTVHCVAGPLDDLSVAGTIDAWSRDWLAVSVLGPWLPPEPGDPATVVGRMACHGRAKLGEVTLPITIVLIVDVWTDEGGRRHVAARGDALPVSDPGGPPRPWLLRLSASGEAGD